METVYFLGVDVSKKHLDTCLLNAQTGAATEIRVENQEKSIRAFFRGLERESKLELRNLVVCMEHTGIYCCPMLAMAVKQNIRVCIEPALQIKQSQGMTRGKNDTVDAKRIAVYAAKNFSQLRFWQPDRPVIQKLKSLLTLRDRLIRVKVALQVPLGEEELFLDSATRKSLKSKCKQSIKALEGDIAKIEKEIDALIATDAKIFGLMEFATSVPGVGKLTAINVIIASGEFERITDVKKFACHAGVAPFEHSSGTSYRGRTRVSKMANMTLKRLLHLAAMSAVQSSSDIKTFYQRKVAEGKNRMSVINAVRNKLISRIYACVKHQRKYQKIYDPTFG